MSVQKTAKRAYFDWLLLSLFFAYQYLLRCCPSVFTNEIRQTFSINAGQFADFGVWCMLVYSCLQIPFGIALDRIGIRQTVLASFGLCLIGQYWFTHASSYENALWGRVLIGIGGAPAYMSALKLVADAFAEKSCGLFIGITGMFTVLVVFCNPLLKKICLEHNDWRIAANDLNLFGAVIFLLCLLFLFPKKTCCETDKKPELPFWNALRQVATDYRVYVYAAFVIGTNIVAMTLADLWGPGFLMTKYHLDEQQAVNDTQLITAGMVLGELLLPILFCSGLKIIRGVQVCCGGLVLIFCLLIYGAHISPVSLKIVLFAMGLFSAADALAFTLGARLSTPQISGMLMSWINSVGMIGEPMLQKWVGFALDRHWSETLDASGLRVYQTNDYESALTLMLILTAVCFAIALFMGRKETSNKAA